MITTTVSAHVKCGSKGTLQRLLKISDAESAEQIEPVSFRCARCGQKWNNEDFSGANDLDRACCSSCYSGNVHITRVKITWLTAKDFVK